MKGCQGNHTHEGCTKISEYYCDTCKLYVCAAHFAGHMVFGHSGKKIVYEEIVEK